MRTIIIGLAALAVAIVAGGQSVAAVFAVRDPVTALRMDGMNSAALSSLAMRSIVKANTPAELRRVRHLARQALRRSPGNVQALQVMGLSAAAAGNVRAARHLMEMAQRFSRRNLVTQLWLIEDASGRGNVALTLKNYDYALSTNFESHELLFPVLIAATEDDHLRKPIARMLRQKPLWLPQFWLALQRAGELPNGIGDFIVAVGDDPAVLTKADKEALSLRLVERGAFEDALHVNVGNRDSAKNDWQSAGRFANEADLQPFAWTWLASGNLSAQPLSPSEVLFDVQRGNGGVLGQKLFALPAGSYRFRALIRSDVTNAAQLPFVRFRCADSDQPLQVAIPAGKLNGGTLISTVLKVGAGCGFQYLEIVSPPVDRASGVASTLNSMSLSPTVA